MVADRLLEHTKCALDVNTVEVGCVGVTPSLFMLRMTIYGNIFTGVRRNNRTTIKFLFPIFINVLYEKSYGKSFYLCVLQTSYT